MINIQKLNKHFYFDECKIKMTPKKNNTINKNLQNNLLYEDLLFYNIYKKLKEKEPLYEYKEKQEKILLMEGLEDSNIKGVKKNKILEDLSNIYISSFGLYFLSIHHNINIIWYTSKCFIKFNVGDKVDTIYVDGETNEVKENDFNMCDKYEIENFMKPLKCMSNYKLDELIYISEKLNIDILVKKKKEIYNNILNYFILIKLI